MLWRKLLRDLKDNKAAYIACVVVIGIGLMVFTFSAIVLENLQAAKDDFYRDYNFADGFIRVRGIPDAEINRIKQIEGVAYLEGRLVKDVRVLLPGKDESIFLRLVSTVPGEREGLNRVQMLKGEEPDGRSRDLVVAPDFFAANELNLGDILPVIAAGHIYDLRISGVGQSPEFVYALRTAQDIYPNPETFGIAHVPLSVMRSIFQEGESYNDLVFSLNPGYSYEDVEARMKPRLERYGLESMYPKKDQVSEVILNQELDQMRGMVTTLPVLFLFVAAVILYILIKRMVEQQRGQIGTLKAFGYTNREILVHYISYAVIIGIAGGILGGLSGIWISFPLTELYKEFFSLPGLESHFSLKYMLADILMATSFSLVAGYFAGTDILKLQPAEAMRPPTPPEGGKTWLEQQQLYWNCLNIQGKMATRNIFRNKARAFFTMLGITFAFAMIATTWYFQAITEVMITDQFVKVQTHSAKVVFSSPQAKDAVVREIGRFPGVNRVEPVLEVPALLRHNWHEKGSVIMGLSQDSQMYNILTDSGEKLHPPSNGVLLSSRLAELLEVKQGDFIEIDSFYNGGKAVNVEVVDVVPQYLGVNAFMEIDALSALLKQSKMATSVLVDLEQDSLSALKDKYQDSERIAVVEDRGAMLATFNELMESYGYMIYVLAIFALITGFAVVYNSSIVSLSERQRELASLRVLGMSPGEVLQILTFEQWFISIFAMITGIPLTILLIKGMADSMNNDMFSIPFIVEFFPFIMAILGTAFFVVIAQWTINKKIHKLSMVEVLKERD